MATAGNSHQRGNTGSKCICSSSVVFLTGHRSSTLLMSAVKSPVAVLSGKTHLECPFKPQLERSHATHQLYLLPQFYSNIHCLHVYVLHRSSQRPDLVGFLHGGALWTPMMFFIFHFFHARLLPRSLHHWSENRCISLYMHNNNSIKWIQYHSYEDN